MNRAWRPPLLLLMMALGAWLAASAEARGQGAPGWAPRMVAPVDGGVARTLDGGPLVHTDAPYRADGGKDRVSGQLKETLEFLLGFDPLEQTAPADAGRSGGSPAQADASPADAS